MQRTSVLVFDKTPNTARASCQLVQKSNVYSNYGHIEK